MHRVRAAPDRALHMDAATLDVEVRPLQRHDLAPAETCAAAEKDKQMDAGVDVRRRFHEPLVLVHLVPLASRIVGDA